MPRPQVHTGAEAEGDARRLGFFPAEALERVREIRRLKREGMSMGEIAARLGAPATAPGEAPAPAREPAPGGAHGLRVTIDEIPQPAYMVNYSFELTWFNDAARRQVLGGFGGLPSNTEARNIFPFLVRAGSGAESERSHDLLRFHFALAKQRAAKGGFFALCKDVAAERLGTLERLYQEAEPLPPRAIVETVVNGLGGDAERGLHTVYAAHFREGILFVYAPGGEGAGSLLALLAKRDVVIRDLVRKRLPVLTHVAVLVADLQNSVKICAELPPEEYFELVNQVWAAAEPVFRRSYGTHGKHAGDGMVYYFFPQPDCSYVMNALRSAHEVREAMRAISKEWQLRKGWANELYLNIGLNEGQEWLGTFQSATHVEFTVLGDTINHAARLSDFARFGACWATKNFLGKLTAAERQSVKFGIRRAAEEGRQVFVASTYSSVGGLVDLSVGRNEKLKDIALLPVTEIIEVASGAA